LPSGGNRNISSLKVLSNHKCTDGSIPTLEVGENRGHKEGANNFDIILTI
jgi:hypothetical protein